MQLFLNQKSMMQFELDTEKIFLLLHKYDVEFILVGGLAVNFYGYARSTGDIDLWIKDNALNRKKLISSLNEYGVTGIESLIHIPFLAGYSQILLDSGIYLDLMSSLQHFGQEDFDNAFKNASDYKLTDNIYIKIISYSELLFEKTNSTRVKDNLDAAELNNLNE